MARHGSIAQRRGVGNFIKRGKDECLSSVGLKEIFWGTSVPSILGPHPDIDADTNFEPNANTSTITNRNTDVVIYASINAWVNVEVFGFWNIIWLFTNRVTNTHCAIILSRLVIGATTFSQSRRYMMGG
ncbi:hypothetical protein GOBAR_AA08433 [Gossypium barbadense]|uniref:Uncharacterized protein n=1 Tax=Gossypium barbadense TaxID=3634 RepID=A0A2P5Y9F7_GOSBA|nr:hypothetical protein GOBAR_AA08433 [Gossypium barbadense]